MTTILRKPYSISDRFGFHVLALVIDLHHTLEHHSLKHRAGRGAFQTGSDLLVNDVRKPAAIAIRVECANSEVPGAFRKLIYQQFVH